MNDEPNTSLRVHHIAVDHFVPSTFAAAGVSDNALAAQNSNLPFDSAL